MSELIEASRQYLDGGMTESDYIGCVIHYLDNYAMGKKEVAEIAKFIIRQGRR